MDITIFRSQTVALIERESLEQLVQRLPISLRSRALRYRSESSAYNYVVGRLLLKHGLDYFGFESDLEQIEYQESGKPVLPSIHFNISHSACQVICALSIGGQIGVDLERIVPIDFDDFAAMFSAKEWISIEGSVDPLQAFYWFWTRKESIIKALGRKLGYLHEIELDVSLDHFTLDGKRWFLRDITIEGRFEGAVCCEEAIDKIELVDIMF